MLPFKDWSSSNCHAVQVIKLDIILNRFLKYFSFPEDFQLMSLGVGPGEQTDCWMIKIVVNLDFGFYCQVIKITNKDCINIKTSNKILFVILKDLPILLAFSQK